MILPAACRPSKVVTQLLGVCLVIFLAGCAQKPSAPAQPAREYSYTDYYKTAFYAQQLGEWAEARGYFSAAIKKARAADADDTTLAVLFYEYGRTSGVVCKWDQAEKSLAKAYALDELTNGPAYMTLYELAQMYAYRKDWQQAERFYRRTYDAFESYKIMNQNPLEYAYFLEAYAQVLKQIEQTEHAALLTDQAQRVRELLVDKDALKQDVAALTPYGQEC